MERLDVIAADVVHNTVISYVLPGQATDDGMAMLLETCARPGVCKFISSSTGLIKMSAKQRATGAKALMGFDTVVLIIDNPLTRGAARAMSWLGVKIKVFSPSQIEDAVRSLGLAAHETAKVRITLEQMKRVMTAPTSTVRVS